MKLRAVIVMLGFAGALCAQDAPDPQRAALAAVVLDHMNFDGRPLSEVVSALNQQISAKLSRPLPLKLDLGMVAEEPKVTCSLTRENADTVLEFITLTTGFAWRIEKDSVIIFTTNVHQAKWKRGERVPEREALRKVILPRMEFTGRPVAEVFLALDRLAKERGLEQLGDGLPKLEFIQKFVEDPAQGPKITVVFDGCSLDDALELLTCRVRGFQWSLYQGAVVSFMKPWQE